jgi:hypothetical protein
VARSFFVVARSYLSVARTYLRPKSVMGIKMT